LVSCVILVILKRNGNYRPLLQLYKLFKMPEYLPFLWSLFHHIYLWALTNVSWFHIVRISAYVFIIYGIVPCTCKADALHFSQAPSLLCISCFLNRVSSFCSGWPGPWSSYLTFSIAGMTDAQKYAQLYWLRWGFPNFLTGLSSNKFYQFSHPE
jgi:hypothetical protein